MSPPTTRKSKNLWLSVGLNGLVGITVMIPILILGIGGKLACEECDLCGTEWSYRLLWSYYFRLEEWSLRGYFYWVGFAFAMSPLRFPWPLAVVMVALPTLVVAIRCGDWHVLSAAGIYLLEFAIPYVLAYAIKRRFVRTAARE